MFPAKRMTGVERPPSYVVSKLEKSATPNEGVGNDWYCYVIDGASTQIVGHTHGSLQQVTDIVQAYVVGMNERAEPRGIYPWTPRSRW